MLPANYETLLGWCSLEKAEKLLELTATENVSFCVELGVYAGRSLLPLALGVATKPGARVVGIDAWSIPAALEGENTPDNDRYWTNVDYNGAFDYATQVLRDNGVGRLVDLWRCKSLDVCDRFEDESIDLLHQDSNHSEAVSCQEVDAYWRKVRVGGFWVFDDTHWPSTQAAQSKLQERGFVEIFSEAQGTWKVFQRLA